MKQHIRHAREFACVFKQGVRFSAAGFNLLAVKTTHDYSRLGMVIGKRYCPLAVNRNRIKRLIREQFRHHQHTLAGVDVVIALRSPTEKLSDQELLTCLNQLFSQYIACCGCVVSP